MGELEERPALASHLRVRYVKLHFTLTMLEDTLLPVQKASALRGGMGEMLLRMHCIRDRRCESCDFEPECLVRRTMYSKMEIRPAFMSSGDSVGYVLECENYEEEFAEGEELRFNLVLFGRTIVYFSQFLQAFQMLGMNGLGKHGSRFVISRLTNTRGEDILEGQNVYMSHVRVEYLEDYVRYRLGRIGDSGTLVFHTLLALKYRGERMQTFAAEPLLAAAERRIYVMNCFEGIDAGRIDIAGHLPEVIPGRVIAGGVRRYSSTHDEKIRLSGIRGDAEVSGMDDTARTLLAAGELLHLGSNTSFGFGRFSVL